MKKTIFLSFAAITVSIIFGSCEKKTATNTTSTVDTTVTDKTTNAPVYESWKGTPKKTAEMLVSKYGQPNEATPSMIMWMNNGIWKRTTISRDTLVHVFPGPHGDYLQQSIDYKVPSDKFDELAFYDGSVIVERTKGEMSARCDMEEANMLALNLADDVINNRKTVKQARDFYTETIKTFKTTHEPSDYMKSLRFTVAKGGTTDPDVTTIK